MAVLGEVKRPDIEITQMAASTDRNNQVGRYLSRTGVVLLSNIRAVGLLACKPGYTRRQGIPVPPEARDLIEVIDLWPSEAALAKGAAIPADTLEELAGLLERAVTEFAPIADPASLARTLLGADRVKQLGVVRRRSGGPVDATDLAVTVSYHGAAKGNWKPRAFSDEEQALFEWGDNTGDLHINGEVHFANVPVAVWRFELGGYPTLKKWLGYRQANRRGGHPLTLAEAHRLQSMIQRLAALLTLHQQLDQLYGAASALSLTAEDLGLRA